MPTSSSASSAAARLPFLVPGYGHQGEQQRMWLAASILMGQGRSSTPEIIFAYRERYGAKEFARAAKRCGQRHEGGHQQALGLGA